MRIVKPQALIVVGLLPLAFALVLGLRLDPIERLRRAAQVADIRDTFETLPLPPGSRLLGIEDFPLPATTRFYGSPWNGTYLCDQLFETASAIGEPKPWPGASCGLSMQIPTGWRSWLAGVYRFELRAFARLEERPFLQPADELCVRDLAEKPEMTKRLAPCWLGADETYLHYTLFGEEVFLSGDSARGRRITRP